jgi:16S rRNA (guanine527-N7)-methyltransferase
VPATDHGETTSPLLLEILEQARRAGFLGPGPLPPQLAHAEGFATLARRQPVAPGARPPHLLDLGSGGGLPGLVVALAWTEATVVLLDANQRRTDFLTRAITRLNLGDRVLVLHARAETAGRDQALRAAFDGVVVRSFGPPATVAECAAPFVRPGGWLIVSEPPTPPGEVVAAGERGASPRWPAAPLQQVGLEPGEFVQADFGYQILRQVEICPDRFPRRNGVPAKNPLF